MTERKKNRFFEAVAGLIVLLLLLTLLLLAVAAVRWAWQLAF